MEQVGECISFVNQASGLLIVHILRANVQHQNEPEKLK